MRGQNLNLIGNRYGRLVVIKKDEEGSKYNSIKWICKCDCGKVKSIHGSCLTRTKQPTISCRCYQKELNYKGIGDLSGAYFATIKHHARYRNIEFNLTIQELWELYEKQNKKCAMTGRDIVLVRNHKRDMSKQTASLDRTDSDKPYCIENVRWVHKHVNLMKNVLDNNYFLQLCNEIVNHQKEKADLLVCRI